MKDGTAYASKWYGKHPVYLLILGIVMAPFIVGFIILALLAFSEWPRYSEYKKVIADTPGVTVFQ